MADVTFGVFLNMGGGLGDTAEQVVEVTLRQAEAAEALGYHDLWLTEHHFIRFGINPSAITTAGFLLGRTRRLRVGTAVVLSPLCHPVELAERAALLDQLSGGRFDLGIGRGGYLLDYQMLGVEPTRWDDEPVSTAHHLLDIWGDAHARAAEPIAFQPQPRTRPHPPLLLATSSTDGVEFAARNGLALQHYFATPASARVELENRYRESGSAAAPDHLHAIIAIVDERPEARRRLEAALTASFRAGDHPAVPQAKNRHVGPDGETLGYRELASFTASQAIIGSAAEVTDGLGAFIDQTGARRIALYHEAIGDPGATMRSLEAFASRVAPQLTGAALAQG